MSTTISESANRISPVTAVVLVSTKIQERKCVYSNGSFKCERQYLACVQLTKVTESEPSHTLTQLHQSFFEEHIEVRQKLNIDFEIGKKAQ
jgi:hypothetical protein